MVSMALVVVLLEYFFLSFFSFLVFFLSFLV